MRLALVPTIPHRSVSMKKTFSLSAVLAVIVLILTGCSSIGDKSMNISVIYCVTAVLAALILAGYLMICKQRNRWFLLLLASVTITNTGYWFLSTSQTLDAALMANRLSYLGSVFLPMSMLMIILDTIQSYYKKWLPALLAGISLLVFMVAASPGYLKIYYAEVSLSQINGVTVLEKVYGPWHRLYLFYLLGYFAMTVGTTASAIVHRKIHHAIHAVILSLAVFVNIGVWLLEQLVKIDFELLSVSYILSELFLLSLDLLLWEQRSNEQADRQEALPLPDVTPAEDPQPPEAAVDKVAYFAAQLPTLTPTERNVFEQYLAGKSSKEIMETLAIKENTLKYHNRNIYSKLGVSSRKQLLELAALSRTSAGQDDPAHS